MPDETEPMSKILEAMRKASPGEAPREYEVRLKTLESGGLFPLPNQQQLVEFNNLANNLLALHDGRSGMVITFASTTSGEGASFVSFNIARQLAFMIERPVAWVDGNFLSPQRQVQYQDLNFRRLLQHPDDMIDLKLPGDLTVVGHGDAPIKSVNLLNSDNYLRLLSALQERFFFVIMDGPPINESVDLVHLAEPTAGVVIVIESRRLKHQVVQHGIDTLRSQNVHVLGTVLNKRVFDIPDFIYRKL
jgi:Mrp family chromosome partitioning ATPase